MRLSNRLGFFRVGAVAANALVASIALTDCFSQNTSPNTTGHDAGNNQDATAVCVPGMSVACVGPGGCAGGQSCNAEGTGFDPCDCSPPGREAGADSAAGADATTADGGPGANDSGQLGPGDASGSGDGPALDGSFSFGDGGCPPGLTCNVGCSGGGTTSISGKVYDPAAKNPLYGIAVYVPSTALQPLPKGVPTGAGACSCAALFPSSVTGTKTAADGTFTLTNVPAGSNVPLVLQAGKWRRVVHVNVTGCQDNAQPDKSLTLPATVAPGSEDNMPDIAVSTGGADTLECLLLRMGLPASEYVAGAATTGHVHIFSGGGPVNGKGGGSGAGVTETNPMPGAPASFSTLWDAATHLMAYDVTLLSCEGGETYNANPPALETYLNAGGRVLASHYHYAWFSGPLATAGVNTYSAPSDWGANLATWSAGASSTATGVPIGGILDQTLNGSSVAFPKGQALQQWLTAVQALGQGGVPPAELSIYQARYNAVVGAGNKPSQPWITADSASGGAGATIHFSFDTPVNAGGPVTCGRAVFSDLHVSGDPSTTDSSPPPGGCANVDLSPQEKALEFTLFDLSGCVVPDSANP